MSADLPGGKAAGLEKPAFTIRNLESIEDYHHAEDIQRVIWGITDDTEVVPKDILLIVQKNGGLAAGAFSPLDGMIGLIFGFLGQTDDHQWKHCSHMMGVLPAYRTAGVGEALKNYQRDFVRGQGLDLITWTVNPLEGVNASLNFGKLGVVCRHYFPNFYGPMADGLNMGLPSDRFEAEWWINSRRVENRLVRKSIRARLADISSDGGQVINDTWLENDLRIPGEPNLGLNAPALIFEVPANFQQIKNISMKTALAWIELTRTVFTHYLAKDYVVSEFISETGQEERRNYYILKQGLLSILSS